MSYNPKVRLFSGLKPITIDYTPVAAVAAGDIVIVNGVAYFSVADIAAGALGALAFLGGVWQGNKKTGALTAGDAIYYKTTEDPVTGTAGTGAFTGSSSGATFVGFAVADAASGDQFVYFVKMPATTVTIYSPVDVLIADPGNAAAIPVTNSGYCPIVTAGSETRTLAAPSFIGQELLLYIKTDGGTCVITVASAINQTGNNTITMAEVRDVIRLVAIESGSSKVWHVVSNDGAALSTV